MTRNWLCLSIVGALMKTGPAALAFVPTTTRKQEGIRFRGGTIILSSVQQKRSSSFSSSPASAALRAVASVDLEAAAAAAARCAVDSEEQAPFVRLPKTRNSDAALQQLGYHLPFGLHQALVSSSGARDNSIRKRFWIVDNSGSMAYHDGHDHDHRVCTRWCEVQETVTCHALLSAALRAPTEFRLLNPPPQHNGCGLLTRGPQRFRVGYGNQPGKDCRRAQHVLVRNGPHGQTPLASAIREVRRDIVRLLPQLQAQGDNEGKVCLVLATDGGNHNIRNVGLEIHEAERNADIVEALESLRGLPVRVVIRLCTDYRPVVDFYNDLDMLLPDLDLDVLDDHVAESIEVHRHNPWLNYALVLHRMREMGQDHNNRLLDALDERPLTRREVREFCGLLFGQLHHHGDDDDDGDDDFSNCDDDWERFLLWVDQRQRREKMQWNPQTQTKTSWIDLEELMSLD